MSRPAPPPWVWFAVITAALLPASFTLDPALDWDTWWHAAVGRWITDHGRLPDADPFSRLGQETNVRWVAYSWLYELAVHGVLETFGGRGVLVLRTLLCGVSAAAVFAYAAGGTANPVRRVLLLFGLAAVLMPFAKERPWHLTIAFTVLTLATVDRLRDGEPPRGWGALPIVFAVWANLHIQFVLGWLILGLACVFPGKADRRRVILLTAGCVAAALANPYHVQLLGVIAEYATHAAPGALIDELAPPEWRSPWAVVTAGLVVWAVVVAVRRRPLDPLPLALLLAAGLLAVRMRRDLWFAALAAAAVLRHTPGFAPATVRPAGVFAATLLVYVCVRLLSLLGAAPGGDVQSANERKFPVRAAAFVRESRLPGPLFNPFDWGGYLIWSLPEHSVSIDGRTNLYGDARLRRGFATWAAAGGWDADLDLTSANLVVAPRGLPLTDALRGRPGEWRVAFEDETAAVFVRR